MTRLKPIVPVLLGLGCIILWAFGAGGCANRHESTDGAVWFVHATDPHRYLYAPEDSSDSVKKSTAFQESQDRDVLSGFFQRVGTLPQISGPPAFILITGDFGIDPCLIPNANLLKKPETTRTFGDCVNEFDTRKRDDEVAEFSALFSASPVRNIYFLAGNNDLPFETTDDSGIAYFNQFFQDVQKKISATNIDVRLHNLTGCYGSKAGAISDCSPDIPGTSYRMIGFPSYSFKNAELDHDKNPALQAAQFATFQALLDEAIKSGKKVIIATHIPEIDDPYYLARDRYDGIKPAPAIDADKDNPRSIYSTWNVQKQILDDWTKVLASDSVIAVLAGHLHDGHKEIYQRPYSWSTLKDYQMGYRKLFLAPPLSVKNQDASPVQARGFSVVSLDPDRVRERLYWYDGRTGAFNADSSVQQNFAPESHGLFSERWMGPWFVWLWNLDKDVAALERMATLLIALLTAFLTVVALWQIPPSDDLLAKKPAATDAKGSNTNSQASNSGAQSSPFTTRFGATVLAGLGGLLVAEVTKSMGTSTPSAGTKWYYIVWFIFFFFFLLLSLNFLRAVTEALRSRVAVIYYPLARGNNEDRFWYRVDRAFRWIGSLRVPVLTFFDTFINLIQGKNQTNSQAFADAIIEQQRNVIRVSDTIRKRLHELLQSRLSTHAESESHRAAPDKAHSEKAHTKPDEAAGERHEVRVNISVLSTDQSNVFYISRSPRSSRSTFPKISVAWISVFTGKNRWYESGYPKDKVVLFDNKYRTIPDAPPTIMLGEYYEDRRDDYNAFVVLPVPQPQRAFDSKYVKGAIHISFSSDSDFKSIWPGAGDFATVPSGGSGEGKSLHYPEPDHLLDDVWCQDPEVRTALNDAVAVLGELLHGFNEVIYKTYILPSQGD